MGQQRQLHKSRGLTVFGSLSVFRDMCRPVWRPHREGCFTVCQAKFLYREEDGVKEWGHVKECVFLALLLIPSVASPPLLLAQSLSFLSRWLLPLISPSFPPISLLFQGATTNACIHTNIEHWCSLCLFEYRFICSSLTSLQAQGGWRYTSQKN